MQHRVPALSSPAQPIRWRKSLRDPKALFSLVEKKTVINVFYETGADLIVLDTGEVIDLEITNGLMEAPTNDQTRFIEEFVRYRIENASNPIARAIPAGLHTFSSRSPFDLMKIATKLGSAKANAVLITKLLLTLKARPDADNDDFFGYESQPKPPSLYDHWKLM